MNPRSILRLAPLLASLLAAPCLAEEAPVCAGRDISADAQIKPDWKAHADDLVNGEGLLWRVEKPGLAPSYLYGTIHSTNAAAIALAREALTHLDGAKSVATELGAMDSQQKIDLGAKMMRAGLSPDADTFAGAIPADEAPKVEAYVAERGFPAVMSHHLKLWLLTVATSLPGCESKGQQLGLPEVDELIANTAKAKGLPVIGLESVDEQTHTLATLPDALSAKLLIASAKAPGLTDDSYVTLLNLYLAKRPSAAIGILDAIPDLSREERSAETEFTRLLLVGRNETMLARAKPLLDKGGAFIAVGALHLVGKNGLIELTRAKDFKVVKVW